ncbi:hypothetical protein D3C80_948250 [compost metagenome]
MCHQLAAQRFVVIKYFNPGPDAQALHLPQRCSLAIGNVQGRAGRFFGNRQHDIFVHQHFGQRLAMVNR